MKSIRVYLIAVIVSVVCLSNFIAALYGYEQSLKSADSLVNQQIVKKAALLLVLANKNAKLPQDLFGQDTLFQVWQKDQLIYRSANSPKKHFASSNEGLHFVNYDGRRWRAFIHQTTMSGNDTKQDSLIIVAEPFDVYSMLIENILLRSILPIIWILPVLVLAVWLTVSFGLKSLRHLATVLDRREVDDFKALEISNYPKELKKIVSSMNGLFIRLESAFDREKHFSADAAHELRTPLSALKVNLHNLQNPSNYDVNLENLKNSVERMHQTIDQLLSLSRVSMSSQKSKREVCDLNEITQSVIADSYNQITKKEQGIELNAESVVVLGNRFALSLMIRNLIDNASKYSPQKGSIHVSIKQHEKGVVMRVEDSGPGISDSERKRVEDRFYRVAGDRHASGVAGSGLGLSIVSEIVTMHNAILTLSVSQHLKGLAVEVVFPQQYTKVK